MRRLLGSRITFGVLAIASAVAIFVIVNGSGSSDPIDLTLGEYITAIESGDVVSAEIKDRANRIVGELEVDGSVSKLSLIHI